MAIKDLAGGASNGEGLGMGGLIKQEQWADESKEIDELNGC